MARKKIDLNTASREELAEVPGIGPSTAEAVIKLRKERGGFKRVDELEQVSGIGPAVLEAVRTQVTVSTRPGAEAGKGEARKAANGKTQSRKSENGKSGARKTQNGRSEGARSVTPMSATAGAAQRARETVETGAQAGAAASERTAQAATAVGERTSEAARAAGGRAAEAAQEVGTAQIEAFRRMAERQAEVAQRARREGVRTANGGRDEAAGAGAESAQSVVDLMREVNEVWLGYVHEQTWANMEAAQMLARCRSPKDLMQIQGDYLRDSISRLVTEQMRLANLTAQLGAQALEPVQRRAWRPFADLARRV